MNVKRENKFKEQIKGARSILNTQTAGIRLVADRKAKVKALIDNTEYSNVKRAFWIGFLLGKYKEEPSGDKSGSNR